MKTVLVVDDEYAILDTVADLLRDEGYQVLTASNGAEGLAVLREDRPDLVLLDLMMPVMDGVLMLGEMRADPHLAVTPVVCMSAGPRPQALPVVQGFLQKPFQLTSLLDVIADHLGPGEA